MTTFASLVERAAEYNPRGPDTIEQITIYLLVPREDVPESALSSWDRGKTDIAGWNKSRGARAAVGGLLKYLDMMSSRWPGVRPNGKPKYSGVYRPGRAADINARSDVRVVWYMNIRGPQDFVLDLYRRAPLFVDMRGSGIKLRLDDE